MRMQLFVILKVFLMGVIMTTGDTTFANEGPSMAEIKDAIESQGAVAVVRVETLSVGGVGTRSEEVRCRVVVLETLVGSLPHDIDVWRYTSKGNHLFRSGQKYIMALTGSGDGNMVPFSILGFTELPSASESNITERIRKLCKSAESGSRKKVTGTSEVIEVSIEKMVQKSQHIIIGETTPDPFMRRTTDISHFTQYFRVLSSLTPGFPQRYIGQVIGVEEPSLSKRRPVETTHQVPTYIDSFDGIADQRILFLGAEIAPEVHPERSTLAIPLFMLIANGAWERVERSADVKRLLHHR